MCNPSNPFVAANFAVAAAAEGAEGTRGTVQDKEGKGNHRGIVERGHQVVRVEAFLAALRVPSDLDLHSRQQGR
jgi:hypothetical protein